MRQVEPIPALVAIAHRTHGQTGRLMGVAWEWRRVVKDAVPPQFLLAHQEVQNPNSTVESLERAIAPLSRPLNLWLLEFRDLSPEQLQAVLSRENCVVGSARGSVDGYRYQQYRCGATDKSQPVG